MDLKTMREWLIQHGADPADLDTLEEAPVIQDIGEGLMLSLQNDDDIGQMLVMLMMQIDELTQRIQTLEAK